MSRLGRLPVTIPEGVRVTATESKVTVTGARGSVEIVLPTDTQVTAAKSEVVVTALQSRMLGSIRSLVANAVTGVTTGWSKKLELSGTGYRAVAAGNTLQLSLGFSHPVVVTAPMGIAFEVKDNKITVLGADRGKVGLVAAKIRGLRPADPYKIKGFKYDNEVIIKKPGKAAKVGGAAMTGAK